MLQPRRLRVADLNPSLMCALCSGYLIDATTIIECLHSFCRSCIVKYLQSNKYCPICDVQVHKTKPLLNIRPDQMLQDIVYKLVPGLFQNEMRRRREWFGRRGEDAQGRDLVDEVGPVCLSLEYEGEGNEVGGRRRYLRCPPAVTVHHLHKLLRAKYGLSQQHRVDVMYAGEPLRPDLTLADIAYIYLWRTKAPLHLTYRIFEVVRCSGEKVPVSPAEVAGGVEVEHPVEETWKEVQLQISENGIMSVTNIADAPPPAVDQLNNNVEDKTPASPPEEPPPEPVPQVEKPPEETPKTEEIETTKTDSPSIEEVPECKPSEPTPPEVEEAAPNETLPVVLANKRPASVEEETSETAAIQEPLAKQPKREDPVPDTSKEKKAPEADVVPVVKNVQQLSSNHPLKIHSRQKSDVQQAPAAIQYSRVGIVPRRPPASPGYKTLRDPPRAWNPQLPARPQQPPHSVPAKPAKFFKVRNNMPRYLGNPASGVKPMYQLPPPPTSTASEPQRAATPRPHPATASVTRVDPKTLRPLPPAPPPPPQTELKINQSTVPILNPLRDKGKPDRRSSPKSAPNGAHPKKEKPQLSFTPANPFVPNIGSPNLPAPNHFQHHFPYFPHHMAPPGLYYQRRPSPLPRAPLAATTRAPVSPQGSGPQPQQPTDPKLAAA